ncbi:hypothetical protein [Patulibacter sp.]|nr:hypothetical protein [Patulibacter sp.]MDO9409055.1 hypothetical protein [Patulibacter sp.]
MNDMRNANIVLRRIAAMFFAACGFGAAAMATVTIVFFATKP